MYDYEMILDNRAKSLFEINSNVKTKLKNPKIL